MRAVSPQWRNTRRYAALLAVKGSRGWLTDWLPKPRIRHRRPQARFAVKHPRWERYGLIGPLRFCAAMSVPIAIRNSALFDRHIEMVTSSPTVP
jgi:hypothetical protein